MSVHCSFVYWSRRRDHDDDDRSVRSKTLFILPFIKDRGLPFCFSFEYFCILFLSLSLSLIFVSRSDVLGTSV